MDIKYVNGMFCEMGFVDEGDNNGGIYDKSLTCS
jgi:hypothetical protein